jgi:DNA polymerase-1
MLNAGSDFYEAAARALLKLPDDAPVSGEQRRLAKAIVLGFLYGLGPDRFRKEAEETYGVALSEYEARRFKRAFLDTYPGIRAWHEANADGSTAVDTVTLAGRLRRNVTSFNEKLNSPVQGTGADILKAALTRLYADRDRFPTTRAVNVIHDEVLLDVDEANAGAVRAWARTHMEAAGREIAPGAGLTVDAGIYRDWGITPLIDDTEASR